MKKETTRSKILQEAERQFIEKGIHLTQIKEIAEAIGINRRTIYRYYPTKDELAFAVEIHVLDQLNQYFASKFEDYNTFTFELIENYYQNVNFADIRELLRFTAEFDRYFQNEYPNKALEDELIALIRPYDDPLYKLIADGQSQGIIRQDHTTLELYHFITQTFLALFQRLILREKHLKHEYCDNIDFEMLYASILLKGIKA